MKKMVLLLFLAIAGCSGLSEEESRQAAENIILGSETYSFDGYDLNYKDALKGKDSWEFIFEFTSSYPGYGDRTGQSLKEFETPHTAIIRVEKGKVTRAVLDEYWDILNEKPLYGNKKSFVWKELDLPSDKRSCESSNGVWLEGIEKCSMPVSDAGKPCTSSDECEGYCIIGEEAACSPWQVVIGCFVPIETGEEVCS
jgi:hypothetical protein